MLDFHVKLVSITRHLDPSPEQRDQLLREFLFWPNLSSFGNSEKRLKPGQIQLAEALLKQEDPSDIHERQIPGEPELGGILLSLSPPRPSKAWRDPVELKFTTIHWQHDANYIAYIPDLAIEVVSDDEEALPQMIEEHIRTAILRAGHAQSLFSLAILQRTQKVDLDTSLINLYPETAKERWDKSLAEDQKQSELAKVGMKMEPGNMPEAFHVNDHVERLSQMLTGRRAMSVLLIGPPGVGKSAIVQQLVKRKTHVGLERHVFWKTSGARIVAGMSGFGDWQERCQKIANEAKEQNAILYFGNLAELLETGRAGGSSENIASFFRPRMVRGELLAILECTPEQLSAIEKRDPRVLDGVRQLKLEEPKPETAFEILRDVARNKLGKRRKLNVDALKRLDALHRRYMGYSAHPGKPVRFLERMLFDAKSGSALTVEKVNLAFSAETGLPLNLLEDAIPLDLEETKSWFLKRLMGQGRAVDFVVDTIAMIKARLARPGKPLGSFLFVGPTGVGKTELAKCLAEFFYNSRERMIRIDMSEYNSPGSATRLVNNNAQDNEGILTAQMRDQPFSVILLDEFEKANSQVFDLFLQVLGEARLTDGAGRVADFSNAIVIMTSNLGAQSFRAGNQLGFGGSESEDMGADEHFTSEAKKRFRPEFFNRIDRIVPFMPLTEAVLEKIVEKELTAIQKRDGLRERLLTLDLNDEILAEVLKKGYDPRYGARPLRRQLEQRVLRAVAEELNEGSSLERGKLTATIDEIEFEKLADKDQSKAPDLERLDQAAKLRRKFQGLRKSTFVSELASEQYRLERAIANHQRNQGGDPEQIRDIYTRNTEVANLLSHLELEADAAQNREESFLLSTLGKTIKRAKGPAPTEAAYDELLIELYAAAEAMPDRILLTLQAEREIRLFNLSQAYFRAALNFGSEVRLGCYVKNPTDEYVGEFDEDKYVRPRLIAENKVEDFWVNPPKQLAAIALEITGGHAALRFQGELGAHEFENDESEGKKKERIVVSSKEAPFDEAWMPLHGLQRPKLRNTPVHRNYNFPRNSWRDTNLNWSGREKFSPELIEQILTERLIHLAEQAL